MAAGGFHQMIVTAHGKVLGTIFEHDLFALQRVSLRQIHHAIRSVHSIKGLTHVAGDIRNLARNLLAQGVSAEALTRTIAALNDALTREVLNRVLQNHDLEGLKWCWLALGSEGRGEQTAGHRSGQRADLRCTGGGLRSPPGTPRTLWRSRAMSTRHWMSSGFRCARATSWPATRNGA